MGAVEMTPTTGVVVTGGASGIGLATARALAEVGRAVAIWDLDGNAALQEASAIADEFSVAAIGEGIDVRQTFNLAAAADRARAALGPIGGLVHSAGGAFGIQALEEITDDDWDAVVNVNLRAAAFLVQALLPDLRAHAGSAIVGIASIAAFVGFDSIPAYRAAKSGLLGLTRSLALGLAEDRIRVNAVCPGHIETRNDSRRPKGDVTPLRRMGKPEDIAFAVRFLLSDQASFVTGQQLVVDGGLLARTM